MKSKIEFEECLKDSPKFRHVLDEEEQDIDHLEDKLQKVIKMCTMAVDSGKEYVKNQSAFATSLWDLQKHFQEEKAAHNALGKIIHCLQEINKFHTTLLDQASRTVLKNLSTFVKTDIKTVKDSKHHFLKVSENLDTALYKNASANKNRPQEIMESDNYLVAVRSCFRHIALDYVKTLTMLQSKKRPEILSTLLSYIQACSTYYHQGSDLCEDFDPFFKCLADDISSMRSESNQLAKQMEVQYNSINSMIEDPKSSSSSCCTSDADGTLTGKTPCSGSGQPVNRMEGYLFKRTSKGFKTWNRRWFYMHDNQLLYKKRIGEELPTVMEDDLRLCTVKPAMETDRRFCFEVISLNKSHMLQADSEEQLHAWIAALQKGIGAAIQFDTDPNRGLDPNSFPSDTPQRQPHKKINLEQFLKIPGNSQCCDCGSNEPRWASINLGIVLCIACSGVHRSLGVHYSKVRSLTLDAWEPEIVKVMMELGNNVINKIYEANIDESVSRPTEHSERHVREAYIKLKYIEKKFVAPISTLLDTDTLSLSHVSNDNENPNEISNFTKGSARWSVRKLRRKPQSRKSRNDVINKSLATGGGRLVPPQASEDEQSETESFKDVPSEVHDIILIGNDLSEPLDVSTLSLCSDQDSTTGGESSLDEEEISALNADLLLYKAAAAHNLPVMCQALAMGGDKNWTNENDNGRKPLHSAVLSGSVMACEFLLLNGAKIDAIDLSGYTALHLATDKGCTAQAYLLLKHRARHDIAAIDGKQPIDIAVEQANADIVTLLRLTQLNEEIGITEQGSNGDETYNDVMKDFSQFAINQPHRLQRPSRGPNDDPPPPPTQ